MFGSRERGYRMVPRALGNIYSELLPSPSLLKLKTQNLVLLFPWLFRSAVATKNL